LTGEGEMFLEPKTGTGSGINISGGSYVIGNNNTIHHTTSYRLDDEEAEVIELIRSQKKNKSKIIAALKAMLGIGLLILVVLWR
jgi:hypothetical protein